MTGRGRRSERLGWSGLRIALRRSWIVPWILAIFVTLMVLADLFELGSAF